MDEFPFPATRGDEPHELHTHLPGIVRSPHTPGMNRNSRRAPSPAWPVPRTRGDEPMDLSFLISSATRSPHTRG